jgi:hypothetical protein
MKPFLELNNQAKLFEKMKFEQDNEAERQA